MPKIKEYSSRIDSVSPVQGRRASGEDLGAGRQLIQAGNALTDIGDAIYERKEQDELSEVSVKLSETQANYSMRLQDEVQKGTLDTEKITAEYEEEVGKISENLSTRGGRQYFEKSASSLKSELMKSAFAGQAELAGAKAVADYKQTLGNYGAILQNDPSSHKTLEAAHEDFINTLVEKRKLPAAAAEKLRIEGRTEIAKQAIRGWNNISPEQSIQDLKSGKWDSVLDGDTKKQLLGEADTQIRAREIDAERAERLKEKQKKEAQLQTQDKFLNDMVAGKLTAQDILKSNLDPTGGGSKDQFLKMLKDSANDKLKTDDGVFIDVFDRIHLPDGDPKKITDENELNKYLGRGLKLEDIKNLRAEMQGRGTMAGKNTAQLKSQIMKFAASKLSKTNPMMGMKDPEGDANLARYQAFFMEEYQKQRAAGKSDLELLTPDSPHYLGQYIGNYTKTPSQIMQDQIKSLRPSIPVATPDGIIPGQTGNVMARKPGESVKEWRARTKAGP